jgi:hypothetical protein
MSCYNREYVQNGLLVRYVRIDIGLVRYTRCYNGNDLRNLFKELGITPDRALTEVDCLIEISRWCVTLYNGRPLLRPV